MLKKIIKLIRKIIVSALLLYGYNVVAAPLNIIIPINYVNIGLISILGFPVLFALIFINVIIF